MSTYAVDLHGLALHVTCADDEILAGIAARLVHLPRAAATDPDILVRYDFAAPAYVPPADARVVYASPASFAHYSPSEDALYAVHEGGATMRCHAGVAEIRAATAASSRAWVLTRPLLTLALMELARAQGLLPVHAACLSRDGAGVLVAGPSGSGKSTLAFALIDAGYAYVSDDLVFLKVDGEGVTACGFPDELGLTEHAGTLFPALRDSAVTAPGWPKGRVPVHDAVTAAQVEPACTPALLLLLEPTATEAVELSADETLLALLPSMLVTDPETCRRHMGALSSLASTAPCLRLPAPPDLDAVLSLVDSSLPVPVHARKEAR